MLIGKPFDIGLVLVTAIAGCVLLCGGFCGFLIRNGARIELSYSDRIFRHARQDPRGCARLVDKFGPINCIPETDLGTWENISPTEGLRCYCQDLAHCGSPADDIHLMVKGNPARLLDLQQREERTWERR